MSVVERSNPRGRASGRARTDHVEFALASTDRNRAVLVESAIRDDTWYLVVGRQHTKALEATDDNPLGWRLFEEFIRGWLPHPLQRSDFCHKLLAVFAHYREYGPGSAPVTELVWEAFSDLVDTYSAG